MSEDIRLCCGCNREFPRSEVEIFFIPQYFCAVTHRVRAGFAIVAACKECLEKRGKPVEAFYSRIEWENGDWTYVRGG